MLDRMDAATYPNGSIHGPSPCDRMDLAPRTKRCAEIRTRSQAGTILQAAWLAAGPLRDRRAHARANLFRSSRVLCLPVGHSLRAFGATWTTCEEIRVRRLPIGCSSS